MSRVEIVAHRGASADAPENTLAAIQLAWQQGADAAEIDVRLTVDGQLVAIHDETTLRTGSTDWKVKDHTLAELKTLDVGLWKSQQFVGEQIPTLAEVLDIVPPGKRLHRRQARAPAGGLVGSALEPPPATRASRVLHPEKFTGALKSPSPTLFPRLGASPNA